MDDMRAAARPAAARLINAHEDEIALVESTTHGNVQWARAHVTRADRLYEQGFVVIGNAARIGSDVGGRDVSELFEHVPARQVHTRQWTAHIVFWSVAIVASADGGQVPSTRNRI